MLDLGPRKGAGRLRRVGSAAAVGTGRWTASAGVRSVGAREWGGLGSSCRARGGAERVGRRQNRGGGGVPRWRPWWPTAEQGAVGRGCTPPVRRVGSVLKTAGRCHVTFPRAPMLTRAETSYDGAATRAAPSGCAHREATRSGRGFPRRPGVRACLGKALRLGRRAGGSDAEDGRHPAAWRTRGRARLPSRCDVAAQRQLIRLALFEKEKLQKVE
jgi:hypothetical protein